MSLMSDDDPFSEVEFTEDWVNEASKQEMSAEERAARYARIRVNNERVEERLASEGKPVAHARQKSVLTNMKLSLLRIPSWILWSILLSITLTVILSFIL